METFTLILSSGFVAALITIITLLVGLGKYKQKVDTHEKSIVTLESEMKGFSKQISKIEGGLERDRAYSGIVKAKSPLSLTEKGERILNEGGGKNYIDNNKDSLLLEIRKANPKSSYDVQELSKQIIESHKNDDDFTEIKEYVYKNGLVLDHVILGMAVYLRDYALKELISN